MARRSGGTWSAAILLALAIASAGTRSAHAQAAASPAPAPAAIAVGSTAPDFALPGATRYGSLAAPVKLSDFRGQTVVIAFFYKARTKG
jgi:cytochrome oxidase Cu insertion factor (SCO1/SenC/PrrC family)